MKKQWLTTTKTNHVNKQQPLQLHRSLLIDILCRTVGKRRHSPLVLWYRWSKISRRMQNITMLPPVRENLIYHMEHSTLYAMYARKLDISDMKRISFDMYAKDTTTFGAVSFDFVDEVRIELENEVPTNLRIPNVTKLIITGSPFITPRIARFQWLGGLTKLRSLTLSNFYAPSDYTSIGSATQLEKLTLFNVEWIPAIWSKLTNLTDLTISGIRNKTYADQLDMNVLSPLVKLQKLHLSYTSAIASIQVVANFPALRVLVLFDLDYLTFIPNLEQNQHLRVFKNRCDQAITDIPDQHYTKSDRFRLGRI